MSKWLLRTAGVLQIAFAGLHGLMPLGWRTSLAYLTVDDRANMYIFNLATALYPHAGNQTGGMTE